jgi:hypothetical protein
MPMTVFMQKNAVWVEKYVTIQGLLYDYMLLL